MSIIFKPSEISFKFFSSEDVLKFSKVNVTVPVTFDSFGNPIPGGLHDRKLGPSYNDNSECETCGLNFNNCPGHYGHIELLKYVYNPLNFKLLQKFSKKCCLTCGLLKITEDNTRKLIEKYYTDAYFRYKIQTDTKTKEELTKYFQERCVSCNKMLSKYKFTTDNSIYIKGEFIEVDHFKDTIKKIFEENEDIMKILFRNNSWEMFFLKRIVVIPNKYRPMAYGADVIYESYHNSHLINILKYNLHFEKLLEEENQQQLNEQQQLEGDQEVVKIDVTQVQKYLQNAVNDYFSCSSIKKQHGVKEFLEKKAGFFRQNMMGEESKLFSTFCNCTRP